MEPGSRTTRIGRNGATRTVTQLSSTGTSNEEGILVNPSTSTMTDTGTTFTTAPTGRSTLLRRTWASSPFVWGYLGHCYTMTCTSTTSLPTRPALWYPNPTRTTTSTSSREEILGRSLIIGILRENT